MASVLIVDDDCDACEALAQLLRRAGHQVRCATNGREALSAVIDQPADLVVLDLRMPVMDGADFLAVMRAYHRLAQVPVVLFTGGYDAEAQQRVQGLNVRHVFLKGRDDWAGVMAWIDQFLSGEGTKKQ